ncbi:MAG: hypothetical protein KGQ88_10520, partial [Chloroflexi bacterium]|nr:hypothetical protein [Chloroflexota bacterium]
MSTLRPFRAIAFVAAVSLLFALSNVAYLRPTSKEAAVAAAASLNVDLDQCANLSTPCHWQNGDLNKNNSAYYEGDVVPFRLVINDLAMGKHSIHIDYDFLAGNPGHV